MNFFKSWNAVVPFEQRGRAADEFHGVRVHFPNRIEHRMIVRIENVFLELRMAGDVDLPDAMVRHVVQIIVGIEVVVLRRDVNVVHIEQNSAVGALDHFAQRIPTPSFPKREIPHSC